MRCFKRSPLSTERVTGFSNDIIHLLQPMYHKASKITILILFFHGSLCVLHKDESNGQTHALTSRRKNGESRLINEITVTFMPYKEKPQKTTSAWALHIPPFVTFHHLYKRPLGKQGAATAPSRDVFTLPLYLSFFSGVHKNFHKIPQKFSLYFFRSF